MQDEKGQERTTDESGMESRLGCRVPEFGTGGGVVRRIEGVAQPISEATEAREPSGNSEDALLISVSN